jgi:apurinic endonuclease APN1
MVLYVGNHASIEKGFAHAVESVIENGGNAVQIFTKPKISKTHYIKHLDPKSDDIIKERKLMDSYGVKGVIHGTYLVNLVNNNINSVAIKSVLNDLDNADVLGFEGVVVHIGSNTNKIKDPIGQCAQLIDEILSKSMAHSKLILENQAIGGSRIGCTLEDIGKIIKRCKNKARIGVCIDTMHISTISHKFITKEEVKQFFSDFDRLIGLKYLTCFHLNDAKTFARDHHEDIGYGLLFNRTLGGDLGGLKELIKKSKKNGWPLIMEVPAIYASMKNQIKLIRRLDKYEDLKDLRSIARSYKDYNKPFHSAS